MLLETNRYAYGRVIHKIMDITPYKSKVVIKDSVPSMYGVVAGKMVTIVDVLREKGQITVSYEDADSKVRRWITIPVSACQHFVH